MTKPGTRIALWAGAAVAVTTMAALAISASVGASDAALSPQDVARELASDPATATALPGSPATGDGSIVAGAPDATGVTEVFPLTPGTLLTNCSGGMAVLLSWTLNPGYRADAVVRGPAATVSVRFESDTADDVTVSVSCDGGPDGGPFVRIGTDIDDHGGDNGGHGGDGGGGSGRDHPEDN